MRTLQKFLVLLTLCLTINTFGQNIKVSGVKLNVNENLMLSINIPESNVEGIVKRTITLNRVVVHNDYTYRRTKSLVSLRKKSNNSKESIIPGKYELVVKSFINGVTTTKSEIFEVI